MRNKTKIFQQTPIISILFLKGGRIGGEPKASKAKPRQRTRRGGKLTINERQTKASESEGMKDPKRREAHHKRKADEGKRRGEDAPAPRNGGKPHINKEQKETKSQKADEVKAEIFPLPFSVSCFRLLSIIKTHPPHKRRPRQRRSTSPHTHRAERAMPCIHMA
jgi:hypothetical protein